MEVKASLNNLRMSAQKTRLLADIVRKMPVDKALAQLGFANKLAAQPVKKLLQSGIANAVNNFNLDKANLYIKEIMVNEGRTLKRFMPKAHGRATTIRKRGCHILLTLGEIKESGITEAKKVKIDEPVKLADLNKTSKKDQSAKIKIPKSTVKNSEVVTKDIEETASVGRHGHAKIEGATTANFSKRVFRRKSG
jgi:large subunit ribosomal protein L22